MISGNVLQKKGTKLGNSTICFNQASELIAHLSMCKTNNLVPFNDMVSTNLKSEYTAKELASIEAGTNLVLNEDNYYCKNEKFYIIVNKVTPVNDKQYNDIVDIVGCFYFNGKVFICLNTKKEFNTINKFSKFILETFGNSSCQLSCFTKLQSIKFNTNILNASDIQVPDVTTINVFNVDNIPVVMKKILNANNINYTESNLCEVFARYLETYSSDNNIGIYQTLDVTLDYILNLLKHDFDNNIKVLNTPGLMKMLATRTKTSKIDKRNNQDNSGISTYFNSGVYDKDTVQLKELKAFENNMPNVFINYNRTTDYDFTFLCMNCSGVIEW